MAARHPFHLAHGGGRRLFKDLAYLDPPRREHRANIGLEFCPEGAMVDAIATSKSRIVIGIPGAPRQPVGDCCSITSETRIAYGSWVWRQGRSRVFWLYQAKSSSWIAWSRFGAGAANSGHLARLASI